MNIGDKVRLLRTSDEGRVIGFKDKNLVEIEIEDGFVIPALMSEVVPVSVEEDEYFGKGNGRSVSKPVTINTAPSAMAGIYLGYIPINENDISLYLFNFTHRDVLYNISENTGELFKSCSHGSCNAGFHQFITYFKMSNFEAWPEIVVELIYVNQRLEPKTKIVECAVKLKAKSFFNAKKIIPTIEKEGYLIEVKDRQAQLVDAAELRSGMLAPKTEPPVNKSESGKKGARLEVDLHIEKIADRPQKVNPEGIIEIQWATFEKELDRAMASGAESVKFIHGIGNGTLRFKIHKHLSRLENIKYFEDADKGRFGFGATVVHL